MSKFDICPSFCVMWFWTWKNLARRTSRPSVPHEANYLFYYRCAKGCRFDCHCQI